MKCPTVHNLAVVVLYIAIGIPLGNSVNGPVGPVTSTDFPYVVNVKLDLYGFSSAGLMLSKRFVLAEYNIGAEPQAVVSSGGQTYTTMQRWGTSNFELVVAKLCTSPAYSGPYYNFATSAHTANFDTNQTGKVLYFTQAGVLVGHDTDVVTNPTCVIETILAGGTGAGITSDKVCIKFQASDCSQMRSSIYYGYPALAINGIVEGLTGQPYCATSGRYNAPTAYKKIMNLKSQIVAFSGVVIANP